MSFINNIKESIGSFFLKQEASKIKRERQMFSLAEAKTIGIILDTSNAENFELTKKYVVYLREMKKKVKVIGYFSVGEMPPLTYSKLEYDFFTWKELNWYHRPSNTFVKNFMNEDLDVLIDLNLYDSFPLKYIATVCKAKFKIAKFAKENEPVYDLMIQTDETKTFKYFLRQVDTYLGMINNPHETKPDLS